MSATRQPPSSRARSRPRARAPQAVRVHSLAPLGAAPIRFDAQRRCFCAGPVPLAGAHPTLDRLYGHPERLRGTFDDQHNFRRGNSIAPDLQKWIASGGDEAAIRQSGMGIWAATVARLVLAQGWTPKRAELPVGHLGLRLGTAVDLFCTDMTGQGVLIEVKLHGNANWQDASTKTLRLCVGHEGGRPVELVCGYTARLRAFLQLQLTKLLFLKTFPTMQVSGCYVVRVTRVRAREVGAALMRAPDWLDAVGEHDLKPRLLGTHPALTQPEL